MKLSVIIPVYLVETTLDRCVESVLCQEIDDMEVILVDDGSTDKCPQICDRWAQRDQRVRVIHKKNGGLSDARNAGIAVATGDYIAFVDSDDWLERDTYPRLLDKADGYDIVEFSVYGRLELPERIYDNMEDYWLCGGAYAHAYAWNKLYRRELFDNVRFPKGRIFEDIYTLPRLLKQATHVLTTSAGYYHYTENPAGITATADGKGLQQLLEAHLVSGMSMDDTYYMYLVNIQMDVQNMTGLPVMIPPKKVNISGLSLKNMLKGITLNVLGINNLCRINKLIHRFKKPSRW